MIISGRRIRSLDRHFALIRNRAQVIVGLPVSEAPPSQLAAVGFDGNPEINTSILPAILGRISKFNAEGRAVPDKTQPKRIIIHSIYKEWEDWHGNPHSGYVDIPYLSYPKIFHPPPSIEFRISATTQGEKLITTEAIRYNERNTSALLHRVNLFLEIFGKCEVFTDDLNRIIHAPIRRLNWQILPRGRNPWPQVVEQVETIIQRNRPALQQIIRDRLKTLNSYGPGFVAVGHGGFHGYLVFAFPERSLYLLESIYFGNATYGFGEDWEQLSQLTKAEILHNDLHSHRIVHQADWETELSRLFRPSP